MDIQTLNKQIKNMHTSKSIEDAHAVVSSLVSLLGIDGIKPEQLLVHTSVQREISKFMPAEGFKKKAAAYEIPHKSNIPIDLKMFWVKNTTKANLSWLVALTPNYEDNPETNQSMNVGIDFVLSENMDKLFVILSHNLKLRVLEISGELSHTQREIFEQWESIAKNLDLEKEGAKGLFSQKLWKSFDFEPVNRKFYQELVVQFDHLVGHLAKNIDEETAKMFTVRLIGRTLFLWFLRKKEFLNPEKEYFTVGGQEDQTAYYRDKLEPLFFEVLNTFAKDRDYDDVVTPFLNGGLFEPIETDMYQNEQLTFPDGFFAQFFGVLDHYNFTVDEGTSEYEQVAVDPEMLGRVFENLLASLSDETGKQARKAKGAFYTPREIVDYMCQQSLIEYLKAKLPESANRDKRIEELVTMDEASFREQDHNKRRDWRNDLGKDDVIAALDELRVLDPAVGSGAFPMGMLSLLVKVYSRIDTNLEHNLAQLKRDILSRSLYGVDIDQMAIQICRLRAWLSILVDMENLKKVEPLPNLDFKFVCANTLIPLDAEEGLFDMVSKDELISIRDHYYSATRKREKEKLRKEYSNKLQSSGGLFGSKKEEQLKDYDPFDPLNSSGFYDPELMHGVPAFDVVIGNPPYVSTKGQEGNDKTTLKDIFGFADDLYSHFYFKGLEIVKNNTGVLSFITPKTFWTIQTKKNVRHLLQNNHLIEVFDTAAPFAAMVDTCVVIVKKEKISTDYEIKWLDGRGDLANPKKYKNNISLYKNAVNEVFFAPTPLNLQVYEKYNARVSGLMERWWDKIETSKKISQNAKELEKYRNSLEPGDVALLGTLTEGGQGLATANNGKYVGVRTNTKQAETIRVSRSKKLLEVNKKIKNPEFNDKNYLTKKSEHEIWSIFDEMKEKYGRDIFGQGYIFRIVEDCEIADLSQMTDEEKKNGIPRSKPHFVPYDKGDKDGNRWWLETPFVIDWSEECVSILQKDPKARWQGYDFYFREGFCWSDIHTVLIKSRLKSNGVYDVKSMSMFSQSKILPDWFFVAILNSTFISDYDFNFVNGTQTFQINDARKLPIVIPTKKQLSDFKVIFDEAYEVKQKQFSGGLKKEKAEKLLMEIQSRLDRLVMGLYELTEEEKEIIRNS